MDASLALILVAAGGYLAAHVASGWLARRYSLVSGAEYLLLGILLGPQLSGLLSASVVDGFAPFLTLALGWIGVVVGSQFYLPELMRIPGVQYRIALVEPLLTLGLVGAATGLVLVQVLGIPLPQVLAPAVVAGCVAAVASPTGIALTARRVGRFGAAVRQLQLNVAVSALVAVAVFGLLLAVERAALPAAPRPLTATEWAVVSVAIGVVGGVLFHLFLGEERKGDRLFIGLAGAVILCSGAAAYLRLSPLFPAVLVGMILVNTSESRAEIRQLLAAVERPIYFVLLIFAGAAWHPVAPLWMVAVVLFLAARTLAKIGSAAFAAWANDALRPLGATWGRALLGQGGLAVAIALNYQIHARSELANLVFTAAIVSVLVSDLRSARVAEQVLHTARDRLRLVRRSDTDPATTP